MGSEFLNFQNVSLKACFWLFNKKPTFSSEKWQFEPLIYLRGCGCGWVCGGGRDLWIIPKRIEDFSLWLPYGCGGLKATPHGYWPLFYPTFWSVQGLTALKTGLWDWETCIVLQKNDAGKCPKLRHRLLLMAVRSVLKTGFWIERSKFFQFLSFRTHLIVDVEV